MGHQNRGLSCSDERADRRALLTGGIGWGVWLCLSTSALAQGNPAALRPKEGDLLVKVDDDSTTPLTPADIPLADAQTMAWAMDPADKTIRSGSRLNRVLLVRFAPDQLSDETKPRAADGVVAYTAICTHSGCEVTEWVGDEQRLFCPCHASSFDPRDSAKVVDGPAPRRLPALPLKVVEGRLVVAKPFVGRVGFERP
jgi:rieske iron-sulfur protein